MLAQAKMLNPECTFVEADMRAFNLPTRFDAVLMDDAISHMNCTKDFEHAIGNAHAHLKPGGVLVIIPDITLEVFSAELNNNHTCQTR